MEKQFQWRIALLDDQIIDIKSTVELLQTMDIYARSFDGIKDSCQCLNFLLDREEAAFIRSCHLILVDMQWIGVVRSNFVNLPRREKYDNVRDYLVAFVNGIGRPVDPADSYPVGSVDVTTLGLMIAAVVSHVAEHAHLQFYSSLKGFFDRYPAAPFPKWRADPSAGL